MSITKEFIAKTNRAGRLRFDVPLHKKNAEVKVQLVMDFEVETASVEEDSWRLMLLSNPAFQFLKDVEEDLYTADDGVSIKP